jgi:hypothetical protein
MSHVLRHTRGVWTRCTTLQAADAVEAECGWARARILFDPAAIEPWCLVATDRETGQTVEVFDRPSHCRAWLRG